MTAAEQEQRLRRILTSVSAEAGQLVDWEADMQAGEFENPFQQLCAVLIMLGEVEPGIAEDVLALVDVYGLDLDAGDARAFWMLFAGDRRPPGLGEPDPAPRSPGSPWGQPQRPQRPSPLGAHAGDRGRPAPVA